MNKTKNIDTVFKEQLHSITFSNKEKMWGKMDELLNAEQQKANKKKRIVVAYSVLLGLFLISGLFVVNLFNKKEIKDRAISVINKNLIPVKIAPTEKQIENYDQVIHNTSFSALKTNEEDEIIFMPKNKALDESNLLKIKIIRATPFEDVINDIAENDEKDLLVKSEEIKTEEKQEEKIKTDITSTSSDIKLKSKTKKTVSFGLEGSIDLLKKKQDFSFSYGINIEKKLVAKASLSIGATFVKNSLTMNYSPFDKNLYNQNKVVASLHSITMLRFPIMFQQQVNNTKFAAKAGLVPTYLLNASITNVANNFIGNPSYQKVFTIKDMNKMGLLFSTGANYAITKHATAQINAFYGLTGLVKDGYLNRSKVNDNLKSLQIGLKLQL